MSGQPGQPGHPDRSGPVPAPTPGAERLAEPLRSRWSPSVFDAAHTLTGPQIATLLTAAQWAPSHGNRQPWRFVVCERGSAGHGVVVAHLSRGNSRWVPRASVVLLAATQVDSAAGDDPVADPVDLHIDLYCLGQATAHLTLQAQAMGLAAHQFEGFDKRAVADGLGVPPYCRVVAGIALGVRGDPAEVPERDRQREHRARVRRPLGEIAYDDRWGRSWEPDLG